MTDPTQLLLASRNAKKLGEMRRIMAPLTSIEVIGLDDVAAYPEAPETGATFIDNALLKAREALAHTGFAAVGDDSGLAVDALNGMPGIFSARWSGRHGDDEANLQLLLGQLQDVPDERLGAQFVCAIAYVDPLGREIVTEGIMRGRLIRDKRGDGGFGYDPIFVADGMEHTSAELPAAEKDAVSHRGKAMRALAAALTVELS